MSKDSIAVINGHEYKYRYNPETKGMDYLGPVGDAPPLSQEEFQRLLLNINSIKVRVEMIPSGNWSYLNAPDIWEDFDGQDIEDIILLEYERSDGALLLSEPVRYEEWAKEVKTRRIARDSVLSKWVSNDKEVVFYTFDSPDTDYPWVYIHKDLVRDYVKKANQEKDFSKGALIHILFSSE
jgi:hypothetical protein